MNTKKKQQDSNAQNIQIKYSIFKNHIEDNIKAGN
jgi:hypothetical protein